MESQEHGQAWLLGGLKTFLQYGSGFCKGDGFRVNSLLDDSPEDIQDSGIRD